MASRARLHHVGWDHPLTVEGWTPGEPGADQVRVRVEACGVCHRDLVDRDGRFPWLQLPLTPGHEAAGVVEAVGANVTAWRAGDRVGTLHRDHCGTCGACLRGETSLCIGAAWVFGLVADGGYATHLVAPANALYALPPGAHAVDVCALHCTVGTAWRGLVVQGGVRAGDRVVVTGANGGVGTAAVQVARRVDATVVAVVRRAEDVAYVEGLGAHEVIVDDGGDFHRRVGAPADVALDCVGSPTFNASLRATRMGGRVVAVGNVSEARVALNLGFVIVNGLRICGSSGATAADMAEVVALHARRPFDLGALRDRVVPLAEADAAQRAVRGGGLHGRIVLDCSG